ncbi:hypothetical protein AAHH80_33765, partial [Burkholderia pseudomallei]
MGFEFCLSVGLVMLVFLKLSVIEFLDLLVGGELVFVRVLFRCLLVWVLFGVPFSLFLFLVIVLVLVVVVGLFILLFMVLW